MDRTVGIRDAQTKLSELLRDVRQGGQWVITDHGRPVARLAPPDPASLPLEERLRRLVERGWIDPPYRGRVALPPHFRLKKGWLQSGSKRTENVAGETVLYWDTSAIIAVLFPEIHMGPARELLATLEIHFISSLGWAEVHATLCRARHEERVPDTLIHAAEAFLHQRSWTYVSASPLPEISRAFARTWHLRGRTCGTWHSRKRSKGTCPN